MRVGSENGFVVLLASDALYAHALPGVKDITIQVLKVQWVSLVLSPAFVPKCTLHW